MIFEPVIPNAEGFKAALGLAASTPLVPSSLCREISAAAVIVLPLRRKRTHEKRSGADEARLAAADSSSSRERERERVSATPSAGLERRPVEFLHQAIGKLLQEFKWHFESGRSIQDPSALLPFRVGGRAPALLTLDRGMSWGEAGGGGAML